MDNLRRNSSNILQGSIGKRLSLGFGLIVLMLVGVSGYSIREMNRLATLTTRLYDHPFTVNTAVLRIEGNIVAMHRSMKDVALATNERGVEAAHQIVNELEQQVFNEFDIVEAQYLGDQATITAVRDKFANWRNIREQVIQLRLAGQTAEAAAITKGEGADYINDLLSDIEEIEDFAENKAAEFLRDAQASRDRALAVTITSALLATSISIILAISITKPIVKSLRELVDCNDQLAQGNLNFELTDQIKSDEIGQLFGAMQAMVSQLRQIVSNVKAASAQMQSQSSRLTQNVSQISSGVVEQAAATEQASASIQRMISNIQNNANHAKETESIANQSATNAEDTRQSMLQAIEVMNSIIQRTSIVQEISQETNMLAINAGIETSRQNQAGQGFAVISGEIRKLAERSREVTQDIDGLASNSVTTVSKAETMLNHLMPSIEMTSGLVREISIGSDEQLSSSREINQSINQLETVTQHNSSLADDLSAIAQALAKQSQDLQATIAFFRL